MSVSLLGSSRPNASRPGRSSVASAESSSAIA
jgi:hypothetical protein